jgi:hypothetical protein
MYVNENQVQNPPSAAYWLSMIGGVLALLGGLLLILAGAVAGVFTFGLGFAVIGGLGIWITICSLVVIISASKLKSDPFEHSKWGAIILVFSLIGSWSLLNFIGGIHALVYKPTRVGVQSQYEQPQQFGQPPQSYAQPPAQSMTRVCPQCGRIVQANERFCLNCGKQLN